MRIPSASKLEFFPDSSAVLNVIGLNDMVEAMYDKRNGSACDEGCREFDSSFLEESLESAPENDGNTCCHSKEKREAESNTYSLLLL